jgi:hypothetical protein
LAGGSVLLDQSHCGGLVDALVRAENALLTEHPLAGQEDRRRLTLDREDTLVKAGTVASSLCELLGLIEQSHEVLLSDCELTGLGHDAPLCAGCGRDCPVLDG